MRLIPASAKKKEKFKSFGELLSFLEDASDHEIERIWAVSAYYDIDSIEQLIEHIKSRSSKKPELFIVIGTIKRGKKGGLKALQEMEFGKFKQGSGIRVTNRDSLFHSKGYLVETAQNGMCAIGSMNLTQNGLKKNEEILTYFRYDPKASPPLVASFKKYVKTWRSKGWSKEIGAVSQGEDGILWLPENKAGNNAHDKFRQKNPEFPDDLSELSVQRYFRKLGLHKLNNRKKLDNERKFTLALYKLLFQECRFKRKPYEGVTLRSIGAGWRSGVEHRWNKKKAPKPGKNERHLAYSAHFDVTRVSSPNETYHCNVWVYLSDRKIAGRLRLASILNVRVENEQKKPNDLQLYVSKPGWKNIWNDRGQYWKIYHDGSMARKKGKGTTHEEVLRAVKNAGYCDWIEDASWWSEGKKVVSLCKLPMAEATWGNSKKVLARKFLARLLHYAIIRADIEFRKSSGKK